MLFLDPIVPEFLRRLGADTKTCGQASLSLMETDGRMAGINQNDFVIGRKAVDFLVDMMYRNERGIPRHRFQFFVEGEWVDGITLHH